MNSFLLVFCAVFAVSHALSLSFVEKGPMPFGGLAHMSTTVVGSKIYFFGGMNTTDYYSRNISYSYDTVTDEWNALADYPYKRYGMCSATDGEQIWVFGGYDAEKAKGEEYHGTYFIANNTWAIGQLPDYIWECSSVYVPETKKVLIVYGFAPEWMYDPAINSFNTSFSDIFIGNTRDMAAGSALYDGKLWLAGSGQDNTVFRTVTTDGLTWDVKTSNPNGFAFMDMVKLGDAMLTFGGTNMSDESAAGYDLINMYNLTSDAWTTLNVGLPLPLNGVSTKLVGPSLYLFGGLYYNGDTAVFNDKYWIVPCVDPTVCENGCNVTTGVCNPVLPPSSTPSAPSGSAAPSSTSPAATPKSKTSRASFYNTVTIGGLLFATLVLLI